MVVAHRDARFRSSSAVHRSGASARASRRFAAACVVLGVTAMTNRLFTIGLLLGLAACSSKEPPAADNTQRNREPITAKNGDQAAQTGTDLELTANIRKALVGDDTLSTNAHNAKIVVDKGVVTLVGPVASDAEKAKVVQLASAAGAVRVVDNLEVIR
jgi:hyperosmotically inducible periplasmic protein